MNPSAGTTEQQDLNWEAGNWEQAGSEARLETTRPYAANRLDWDWHNPMILAQHPGGSVSEGDAECKSPVEGSMASSLRAYTGILSSGFPSNFSQNPMGVLSSSCFRSFVGVDSNGLNTSSGLLGVMSSSSNTPGIPGLAPTSGGHGEARSTFEQRRRHYFGVMDQERKGRMNDFSIKLENETYGIDGHGTRIGLNLGVRTYFSAEDTAAAVRLTKRHRANSPSLQVPACQAEGCKADLSTAKHYHRRHKVCELHSKAANVVAAGHTQRFCQQCSRFHPLSEFDEGKRSCRKRLADHNRRRRKPQLTASAGGTSAESDVLKTGQHHYLSADPKSIAIHMKKSGSACSVPIDESDEKVDPAMNKLQLGSTSGLERSSQAVIQSQNLSASDPQALLSAMSVTPSVPLMVESPKQELSILHGSTEEAGMYQQFLQGIGQTGPNLSLSCLGGGGLRLGRLGQNYSGMDPPVPWSRPSGSNSDVSQSGSRSSMNLQLLVAETTVPRSHQLLTCNTATSAGTVYSSTIQNLLPRMPSREIGGPEWIVENQGGVTHFGSCLSSLSRGNLDEHQFSLLESRTLRDGFSGDAQQVQAVESLQHHGGDSECTGGTDLKFPDLQSLRPSSFGPAIYDAQVNIL